MLKQHPKRDLVIYAEDLDDTRQMTTQLLKLSGFEVRDFPDGGPALEAIQSLSQEDLNRAVLLTDHDMNELNGLDLVEALAQRGISLPTAVLSGNGEKPFNARMEQLKQNGALSHHTLKPAHDLEEIIQTACDSYEAKNKEPRIVAYKVGEPGRIRNKEVEFSNKEVFADDPLFADPNELIKQLKEQDNPTQLENGDQAVLFVYHDDHLHAEHINKGDMERLNGIEFINKLKENDIHIPTVLITKNTWDRETTKAIEQLRNEGYLHYHASHHYNSASPKPISHDGSMERAAKGAISYFHKKHFGQLAEDTASIDQIQGLDPNIDQEIRRPK